MTELRYADGPGTEVDAWIAAAPESLWPQIVGLDAMVAASAELQAARWLDDPGPGARFTGTNRREDMGEWTTTCVVVAWEPARVFGWEVHDSDAKRADGEPPMARWRFTLAPEGDGTRVAQSVTVGPGRSGLSRVVESMPDRESRIVAYRLGDFEKNMRANFAEFARRVSAPPPG